MKKALILILALLMVMSVVLAACDVKAAKITLKDVPEQVTVGEQIDYSKISIDVEYEDGKTENLSLTASGVTYKALDTSKYGRQLLTVSYKGATDQAYVKVVPANVDVEKVEVAGVTYSEGYNAYREAIKEKTNKDAEFYNRDVVYNVGNDNGYVCVPSVLYRYEGVMQSGYLPAESVYTTYKLSIKNGSNWDELSETQLETYLSNVENNTYYFTEQAENETFKLDITLSDIYNLISANIPITVSQVFEVVSGYNVYDALGLSVLDNKNVKSWAKIKTEKLDWDNGKALSEFADVKQVVIHNNIKVTADDLPDNYFWHVGDEAKREGSMSYNTAEGLVPTTLKDYLPGSLKEAWLGEDWEKLENDTEQRGLYVSNGIGISGNCLMLSYDSNVDAADKSSKGIYIVHDYKQTTTATDRQYPESHYSFVVYTHASADKTDGGNEREEAKIKGTRTIKNVYFYGETQKTDDVSNPVGLMMLSADISGLEIINTISTRWYCNAQLDGVGMGTLKLQDCKFYESFSQMVFCWGIPQIDVIHCEMKKAGGPLFIIQTRTGTGNSGKNRNSVVNIDDASNMESWLAGAETWFDINNLPSATVEQLFAIGTLSDNVVGTHYQKNGKVNVIAVVIPDPGDVFKNQIAIPGTINIGESVYSMDDEIYKTILTLNTVSETGSTLAGTTQTALGKQAPASIAQLKKGFEDLALSPVMPVYKSGTNYGYSDGKKFYELSQLQQLYGGALQVQSQLNTVAGQYEAGGDAATAAQLRALATQWGKLAATANLAKVGTYAGATSEWNAGQLAFWVNPGGLNASNPNLNLKHFMVLFGESAA